MTKRLILSRFIIIFWFFRPLKLIFVKLDAYVLLDAETEPTTNFKRFAAVLSWLPFSKKNVISISFLPAGAYSTWEKLHKSIARDGSHIFKERTVLEPLKLEASTYFRHLPRDYFFLLFLMSSHSAFRPFTISNIQRKFMAGKWCFISAFYTVSTRISSNEKENKMFLTLHKGRLNWLWKYLNSVAPFHYISYFLICCL